MPQARWQAAPDGRYWIDLALAGRDLRVMIDLGLIDSLHKVAFEIDPVLYDALKQASALSQFVQRSRRDASGQLAAYDTGLLTAQVVEPITRQRIGPPVSVHAARTVARLPNRVGVVFFHRLTSMNNLAMGYYAVGKLDLALPLLEETLKVMKAKHGPDHPDTLTSMNNLAGGYYAAGKLDLALPLLEETLKLRKTKLGADHPDTLTSMNNLGGAYWRLKQLDKSIPLLEETLKLRERSWPRSSRGRRSTRPDWPMKRTCVYVAVNRLRAAAIFSPPPPWAFLRPRRTTTGPTPAPGCAWKSRKLEVVTGRWLDTSVC